MNSIQNRENIQLRKEKIRRKYKPVIDPANYTYIPEKKQTDYYDNDVHQRIAIYVRVSTDDIRQTTSYELQKTYYEEFVTRHPNWALVDIYADEGISGTSLKHRDEFNRMIADCRAGKIDMIITKSVSRFARNVEDFVGTVRSLAELRPRVGVFFESEAIFSLNDDSQMALTFQATMAEEESHIRSRSMETSLRMRLDHGIPLTPKLYGYTTDEDGELQVNPDEAPTVKLIYFMYLYGYSTRQIANTLIEDGRRSYYGKLNWTPSGIAAIMRNERHCGDVLTRKTLTESYRTHRIIKNRGERPQSIYRNHHEPIISRDDFIAAQRLLDNAKYRNSSTFPELRVIDSGILKGFVTICPRWSSFRECDYYAASKSAYLTEASNPEEEIVLPEEVIDFEVQAGDFDLRGFEVARSEFFDSYKTAAVTFSRKNLILSSFCIRKLGPKNTVELLINPIERKFALRTTSEDNKRGVQVSQRKSGHSQPRHVPIGAFSGVLFSLFGWNLDYRYRVCGQLVEEDEEVGYIFEIDDSQVLLPSSSISKGKEEIDTNGDLHPLTPVGRYIRAIPESWTKNFGSQFYVQEKTMAALENMTQSEWELQMQGQLFKGGFSLNVTGYEELKAYIMQELGGKMPQEAPDENME